jgi:hypothetical protein
MKREQGWKQEQGTFYAVNKQRKRAYRRLGQGTWEPVEPLSKEAVAAAEEVGWDRIEDGWFSVYRLR